jgi:transcriptional regulator with XRE-family HTH domain
MGVRLCGTKWYHIDLEVSMDKAYIAERLRNERLRRDLTQMHVAEKVTVSQSHLSNIERGKAVDLATAKKLCELYDMSFEDLVGRFFGIKTALQHEIENAVEIGAEDRALLLSMYKFMKDRGPYSEVKPF